MDPNEMFRIQDTVFILLQNEHFLIVVPTNISVLDQLYRRFPLRNLVHCTWWFGWMCFRLSDNSFLQNDARQSEQWGKIYLVQCISNKCTDIKFAPKPGQIQSQQDVIEAIPTDRLPTIAIFRCLGAAGMLPLFTVKLSIGNLEEATERDHCLRDMNNHSVVESSWQH